MYRILSLFFGEEGIPERTSPNLDSRCILAACKVGLDVRHMSGQCNLDRTSWSNKHFRDFRTIKSWSANSKGSCCRGLKIQLCTVCHYGERKNVRLVIFSRVRFKKRRENTYNNCIGDVRTGFHRHCGNIKSTSPSGMTKQNSRTSR